MKKATVLLVGIILFSTVSCKKFLATKPQDFSSPEQFYSTEQELNEALAGVYNALAQDATYGLYLSLFLAHGSDEAFYKSTTSTANAMAYDHNTADTYVNNVWRDLYMGINRANYLLANIGKPVMDEGARNVIRGEALFLRAYMYFQLVSLYGDVPLLLNPSVDSRSTDNPRTPASEVYRQILSDMTVAKDLVNSYTVTGKPTHVSKTAIMGVLARVCLTMAGEPLKDTEKYKDARGWADSVIQSGIHQLNPDYKQVFINECADLYDTQFNEVLWEIEFYGNNNSTLKMGSRFVNYASTLNRDNIAGYAYERIGVTAVLYRMYHVNDLRRDWCIAPYSFRSNNGTEEVPKAATDIYSRSCGKWRRKYETALPRNTDYGPTNFPIIRYADVLLMYAEADNAVNGGPSARAYEATNQVRRRGYGKLLPGATNPEEADLAPGLGQEDFLKEMQQERARELAFEALRKFDLIRWGIFLPVMKAVGADIQQGAPTNLRYATRGYNNVSEKHKLLPIPSLEMSLNKAMEQNPLWK
ncbi:RagB/SusD family nutrient uptake outer membrane protein [Chitinophaga alhagiae]|uniref:RagB/SusD family nutrient uptake outer membrane protein n=1 Tax=Chitinophaga alhagiae TaxID=2203219 RepID=UPI000E5BC983|nr:RagB/SusD family nutrient uptake outer membrane protein [Chitinophaga alhagiae]